MRFLKNFLKGAVAGIGGIAPGLSGSVMLVILGLYEQTVHAIGTLFVNFKKNLRFLIPLSAGMVVGILGFSKLVDFFLRTFEFQTRYAFLGMILGAIPLFYREVRKKGFRGRHYLIVIVAAAFGFFLFGFNQHLFPKITDPNLGQSVLLGVVVAGSSVVPGVDSAAILSALGMYELYLSALAEFDIQVLLPALGGLILGALGISVIMNLLIKKAYTVTFSVVFGLFLSVIPSVLSSACVVTSVPEGLMALVCILVGCLASWYLGDVRGNNKRIKDLMNNSTKKNKHR